MTDPLVPESKKLIEVIQVLTEVVRLGIDLDWVMQKIAEKAQAIIGGNGAVVEFFDKEAEEMVYKAASGSASGQLGLRLPFATSLSGMCVARAVPLRCDDSETDTRVNREACRKVSLRSMICVPLFHQNESIGVLKVLSGEVAWFKESDVVLLDLMAGVIAATMYNALRYGETELFKAATTDSLTGLANRLSFMDRLRQSIYQAERSHDLIGVLMIDMDGLKAINDTQGHLVGDHAIQEIGNRIKRGVRQADTVARFGGDEFAVILGNFATIEDAINTVKRINEFCDEPYSFDGISLKIGASIGLAIYPFDGQFPEALIQKADELMYEAKRIRKGLSCLLPDHQRRSQFVPMLKEDIVAEARLNY